METATSESQPKTTEKKKPDATRTQIRGSSLLLVGRLLSVGINFASQVLIVRYLTQADYGAWAYALSMVAFLQGFAVLGLDRAITRFVPIYHEKNENDKMFGTIFLVVGTIMLTGLIFIIGFYLAPEQFAKLMKGDSQPFTLLYVLIFLVPVEALDLLLIGLFASFASPKAIFFRKHVLGPCLKLTVVVLLLTLHAEVIFLAYGYLGASLLGILIYTYFFIRLLRKEGISKNFKLSEIKIPAKEIFSFTIPLMTSDLVSIVMNSVNILLLGYFYDSTEVAFYRVVIPAARLNKIVMTSFALLYTPLAARMFAKDDFKGINDLYWRTAIWLAVLSFPIFALTFSVADPLTVFLYEARYEKSGMILALMSLGYYFSAVLGFNGLTLKVLGKLKYIVTINIIAVLVSLGLNIILIPKYGALGAAIGMCGAMIVHNIMKQAGLRLVSGISLFDKKYLGFYLLILFSSFGLFAVQFFIGGNIFIALGLAGAISLVVLMVSKKRLNVAENFPELLKLPVVGK
ncbi:MAG: oligosaccharide flippase family protein, partial [bacterium]